MLLLAGCSAGGNYSEEDLKALAELYNRHQVKTYAAFDPADTDPLPPRKGKVLVMKCPLSWNGEIFAPQTPAVHDVTAELPDDVRADSRAEVGTIVFVDPKTQVAMKDVTYTGRRGRQVHGSRMEGVTFRCFVTVFDVASKKLVGSWAVESPETIPVLVGRMPGG